MKDFSFFLTFITNPGNFMLLLGLVISLIGAYFTARTVEISLLKSRKVWVARLVSFFALLVSFALIASVTTAIYLYTLPNVEFSRY